MEIKKVNLKWNGKLQPIYLANIKYIMLHHTAHPTWTIEDVHRYHKLYNKWIGIGYNYFIEKDGTIEEARGMHQGAGATGYNRNSIHICFAGNFENEMPTEAQIKSGKELVKSFIKITPIGTKIIGHKDIGKTACPGKHFPLSEFKKIDREEEIMISELTEKYGEDKVKKALVKLIEAVNDDGKPSNWAKEELQQAIDKGITDGTNPEMFATRQEVAIMINRATK